MDEAAKRHARPPDPADRGKLLERIISLETLRERNNQQLLVREQEMEVLRQQLSARGGEVVASLQAQLEQRRRDVEQRDRSFQNLTEEMENLKNRLAAAPAHCQVLEGQAAQIATAPSGDLAVVQDQLRDALEKNQQWLTYDQQREAYVRSVLAHTVELEQQLAHTKQANPEASKAVVAAVVPEAQSPSEQQLLLQGLQKDLEAQREAASRAHLELQQHKDQINLLQKSLLTQAEEQRRIATLEQQDFENEKLDRQSMRQQLHKVLKELRKARDQITRLEAKPSNTRFSEPSSYHALEFDRLAIREPRPESPSKVGNFLDESFLECPGCHKSYPTSKHRELLAHIDYCLT